MGNIKYDKNRNPIKSGKKKNDKKKQKNKVKYQREKQQKHEKCDSGKQMMYAYITV